MNEWMKTAWYFQQEIYKILGKRKWDDLEESEENVINKLIIPFEFRFGKNYKDIPDCKKITDHVEVELLKLFNKKSFNARFDCTFINVMMKNDSNIQFITCLFWLQNEDGSIRCLDLDGRNYKSWEDFLENNVFPKCHMIYPKNCRYFHDYNNKEEFAEIALDESVACGTRRRIKNVFGSIATLGGMAATTVLVSNPVSGPVILGAAAVTSVCGGYSAVNSICRLVDIEKHEGGLSLTEKKTLLTAGELALNVVGTAAVGVSAGIKGFTATTGKVLAEGSLAFKVGNNFCNITRAVSGFNAGFNIVVVVSNYHTNGRFTRDDILTVGKILFYAYNVYAEEHVIMQLISYLASNFKVEDIFQYFVSSPLRAVEVVRDCYRFCSENDLFKLINLILPDCIKQHIPKYTDIISLVQLATDIVDRFVSVARRGELDVQYLFTLQMELKMLWNKYCIYRERNEFELRNKSEIACNYIKECIINDGIDLVQNNSRFNSKISSLFEVQQRIRNILEMCCRYDTETYQFKMKEKLLFSQLCRLAKRGDLKNDNFFVSKIDFLCNYFESLYKKFMSSYNYGYFFYKYTENKDITKTGFLHLPQFNIADLREHIFIESLNILKENIDYFLNKFENEFQNIQANDERKERILIEFTIPNCCVWLDEEEFYSKAEELLPKFRGKLNKTSTTFEGYERLNLAIIKSKQDDFILFFYVMREEYNLKGVLLLDENLGN